MLSHSEHHHHENKMPLLISSSTTNYNQWPQMQQQQQQQNNNIQIDEGDRQKTSLTKPMSSSTSSPAVPAQHQALKCPRCDSSNTKFCYYNNYSLSQPRHFCKACKRYWTRGGTLRNVPVGGGCRKNKRVKRPGSSAVDGGGAATSSTSSSAPITTANNNSQPSHHLDQIGPLFYGLPTNPFMEFDLQAHQMGLGFSSSAGAIISSGDGYRNRFDIPTSNNSNSSLPSNYSSIFSTSSLSAAATATATTAPTMASVLTSKFINGGATFSKDYQAARAPPHHNQYFQNLLPFEDLQIAGGGGGGGNGSSKEVKVEDHGGGQNRLDWMNANSSNNVNGNMNHEQMGLSDPNNLYWSSTTSSLGVNWHDPSNNLGSSVSSLI